ncbi:MAG: hypothetical protein R2771_06560 [Saprospiraceae bacterium]
MKSEELIKKQKLRLLERASIIALTIAILLLIIIYFSEKKIEKLNFEKQYQADIEWKKGMINTLDSLVNCIDTIQLNI